MDSWVRFNAQSQAKEKLFRAVQYACTLLGYTLQKGGTGSDLLTKIKQLEAHVGLVRKLMRLGNSAEALEAAKRAIHLSDCVLRLCITVSHLNRAMYFACDNVLWAGQDGPPAQTGPDQVEPEVLQVLSLRPHPKSDPGRLRDQATNGAGVSERRRQRGVVKPRELHLLVTVLRCNPPLLLDLVKNGCDLFIPLERLGLYQTGPGFVGACGLASSVLSLLTILYPWLKLKP
ncbi:hypothetical protein SKAU_G00407970 [Synaphobranchus kaupii]|uniref:Peroxisomal biogenesis factor 11 beta n=1 Tax=Synaphobranchus kaupii TaxID=118154 RepID=A0A9Q1IB13_SYNKA|nr:hypothetical protein SKAU_G00407970 [Synaphobranchus kaupii]